MRSPEAPVTRGLASTIVTPSRVDIPIEENVTKHLKEATRALSFPALIDQELQEGLGDKQIIGALSDMEIADPHDGEMMECDVRDDDLLGQELTEMDSLGSRQASVKIGRSDDKPSRSRRNGAKTNVSLGITSRKFEILRRGSPRKRLTSSHVDAGKSRRHQSSKKLRGVRERKLHYSSDWHSYNLKRKVAGAPGVTEELFEAKQSALAMEKGKSDERPMLYTCRVCGKSYRSSKAHEQHCKSWRHVLRVSQGTASNGDEDVAIVTPLPRLFKNKDNEENSDEELADADEEEASDSLSKLNVNESGAGGEDDADMHKHHGFFVPNVEYLKDPEGLLTYLGLKVKRDFMCLYCSELCHAFSSLEAVRKHMEAKSHCKLHYGDKKEARNRIQLSSNKSNQNKYSILYATYILCFQDLHYVWIVFIFNYKTNLGRLTCKSSSFHKILKF
ncbi:hypothetical protein Bca52824_074879 [Brassica carinata]|uniref:C2H2-type domain-containing protein n=1 Tax=Brassica carinata TaxID=52824 RepID=A0A8X7TUW5_BRACI|nr:hypothetical protein Bca52824_074879 [Brassica carinata]